MEWRRTRERPRESTAPAPSGPEPSATERASPGISTFFDGIEANRTHAILDLGLASPASFEVYSRYARWIRFEELRDDGAAPGGWAAALEAIPANPERPYDLILAWGVLDHLPPHDRPRLIERLTEISAPDARLFLVVDSSDAVSVRRLDFSLPDTERMRFEPAGAPTPRWGVMLPAETEKLLAPFRVVRAFTSKVGLREYVAVRDARSF